MSPAIKLESFETCMIFQEYFSNILENSVNFTDFDIFYLSGELANAKYARRKIGKYRFSLPLTFPPFNEYFNYKRYYNDVIKGVNISYT